MVHACMRDLFGVAGLWSSQLADKKFSKHSCTIFVAPVLEKMYIDERQAKGAMAWQGTGIIWR